MPLNQKSIADAYEAIVSGNNTALNKVFAKLPPSDSKKGDPGYHLANATHRWANEVDTSGWDRADFAAFSIAPEGHQTLVHAAIEAANDKAFKLLVNHGAEIKESACIRAVVDHLPFDKINDPETREASIKIADALTNIVRHIQKHGTKEDMTYPLGRVAGDKVLFDILWDIAEKNHCPVDYTEVLAEAIHSRWANTDVAGGEPESALSVVEKVLTKKPKINDHKVIQEAIRYAGPHMLQILKKAGLSFTCDYLEIIIRDARRSDILSQMIDNKTLTAQEALNAVINYELRACTPTPPERKMVECCLDKGALITQYHIKAAAQFSETGEYIKSHRDSFATFDYLFEAYDAQLLGKSRSAQARLADRRAAIGDRIR